MFFRLIIAIALALCFFLIWRMLRQKIAAGCGRKTAPSQSPPKNKGKIKQRGKLVQDPKTGEYHPEHDDERQ